MFVVTGDETGLVKLVDVTGRTYLRYGEVQSRANAITAILSAGKKSVLTVRINGEIEHYNIDVQEETTQLLLDKSVRTEVVNPIGFKRIIQNGSYTDKMLLFNAKGSVSIYDSNAIKSSKSNLASFDVRGPLSAAALCNNGQVLFGGKENDARLYSIETQEEIWAAKNVSQDKLHLRVPVWITCMAFHSPMQDSLESDSSIFYTGTAYRHVRMYDMKAGQKPCSSIEIGPDFRVSAIQPARGSENYLYVADTTGGLTQWDMRTQRRVHTLKGAAGSIREMSLSEDGQHLATVGLDRFLRVYDTKTQKLQSSIYLKNRLNSCVFVTGNAAVVPKEVKTTKKRAEGARVDNEDDEDVLHELGNSDDDADEESGDEVEGSDEEEEGSEEEVEVEENGDEEQEEEGSDDDDDKEEDDSQDDEVDGSDGEVDQEGEEGSEDEEDSEEGSDGEEGSDEDSEQGSGSEEGSEEDGSESEEEVVATFKWGGAAAAKTESKPAPVVNKNNNKNARPVPVSAPAKKARR